MRQIRFLGRAAGNITDIAVAENRFVGRASGGDVVDLTADQAKGILGTEEVATGSLTEQSIGSGTTVLYINTGFYNPGYADGPASGFIGTVEAGAGTRNASHDLAAWITSVELFRLTGLESGSGNTVTWQGLSCQRGTIVIKATFECVNYLSGDLLNNIYWSLLRILKDGDI